MVGLAVVGGDAAKRLGGVRGACFKWSGISNGDDGSQWWVWQWWLEILLIF